MSAAPPLRAARGPGALALLALLLAALLPRLWRFEAVGEGTDEAYSVMATRAIVEGRFSYRTLDDFTADGYQAKFTPVAEALAVPFVRVLGDRPLAYRLPALLASLATLALLARHAGRRYGAWAVAALAALSVLDYRALVYAQTHRYVAVEQLLLVGAFLAALRAERTRRAAPALLAGGLALLAFHAHFLALLALAPLAGTLLVEAVRSRGGVRRFPAHVPVVALVAVEAVVVLALFRAHGSRGLFETTGAAESLRRAGTSSFRMLGGQGLATAIVGVPGAFLLLRRRALADRLLGAVVVGGVVLFALGCLRYDLRPRYALCLQPFLWLAGAALLSRGARAPAPARPWPWAAILALAAAATAWPGVWYLSTGGGRDAEEQAIEILRREARAGEGVLYDTGYQDPYRRRPAEYPSFPKERAREPGAEAALDAAGVRWLVRSSAEPEGPLYTPEFRRRLLEGDGGGLVLVSSLFQFPSWLEVRRIAPR